MQNIFDISEIAITNINTIYSHSIPICSGEKGKTEHNTIVIKLTGSSVYTISGNDYTADRRSVLFLPSGTDYTLTVNKCGPCVIIEFDTAKGNEKVPVRQFATDGEKELVSSARNLVRFWSLGGPAYRSKCLSELYNIITQLSIIDSYTNTLAEKYALIHRSVKYIEENYRNQDLSTPMLAEMSEMGETYYRNIFYDVFKCSPNRYIRNMRVEKPRLLASSDARSMGSPAFGICEFLLPLQGFQIRHGGHPRSLREKSKAYRLVQKPPAKQEFAGGGFYSTVTDFARFLGLSTSIPLKSET